MSPSRKCWGRDRIPMIDKYDPQDAQTIKPSSNHTQHRKILHGLMIHLHPREED